MRVVVVGAGAIGAPLAAFLFERGHAVTLVARGANYEAIAENGLTVATPERTLLSKVNVVNGIRSLQIHDGDAVIFCMKSQDTAGALDELTRVAAPETAVFCAQNGVANERMVSAHFSRTYGICVMTPGSYLEPGRVESFASPLNGVLDVGLWPTGVDDSAREMSTLFIDAEYVSIATTEIETLKWGKLLSNIRNALEVLCGRSAMSDELEDRVHDEAVECLAAHGVDVARAMAFAEERSALGSYNTIGPIRRVGSSSWQSVLRGTGNVETDYLNGEIVQLGRRYAIATPVNELLQRRVNKMAREHRPPGTVSIAELHEELNRTA